MKRVQFVGTRSTSYANKVTEQLFGVVFLTTKTTRKAQPARDTRREEEEEEEKKTSLALTHLPGGYATPQMWTRMRIANRSEWRIGGRQNNNDTDTKQKRRHENAHGVHPPESSSSWSSSFTGLGVGGASHGTFVLGWRLFQH